MICATPRCGSNLLCDGLTATGLVGNALEYLNPSHRHKLERRWDCDGSLGAYLRALYGRRTSDLGYLGIKVHWDQLVALRAEALGVGPEEPEFGVSADFLERLFPGAQYVRMTRRDVNRQAVSYWLAFTTDRWIDIDLPPLPAGGDGRVFYSFEGIERCRRLIENFELHWDRFLRANGIEPLVVEYERLVEDWSGVVGEVVRHLRPDAQVGEVRPSMFRRQGGELADEMLERFARDRERSPLPDPVELLRIPPRSATGRYRRPGS